MPPRAGSSGGVLLLVVPALLSLACTGTSGRAPRAADPESVLWGGRSCNSAADCPSALCTMGVCLGFLAASSEEARDTVAPALRTVGASAESPELVRLLEEALGNEDSDAYVRGRAADAFRFLPAEAAARVLPPYLDDPDEPVRFFAARALAVAGDARGREALAAFLDHPAEAVRLLAQRAAGGTDGRPAP